MKKDWNDKRNPIKFTNLECLSFTSRRAVHRLKESDKRIVHSCLVGVDKMFMKDICYKIYGFNCVSDPNTAVFASLNS